MVSSAAIQPSYVPSQPMGVHSRKSTSPANSDAFRGQVHQDVAGGVRRADVDQLHGDAVEVELQALVDQRRRRAELDAAEVPVGEPTGEVGDRRLVAAARRRAASASPRAARAPKAAAQRRWPMISACGKSWFPHAWSPLWCVLTTRPAGARHTWRSASISARVWARSQKVSTTRPPPRFDEAGVAGAEPPLLLEAGEHARPELVQIHDHLRVKRRRYVT